MYRNIRVYHTNIVYLCLYIYQSGKTPLETMIAFWTQHNHTHLLSGRLHNLPRPRTISFHFGMVAFHAKTMATIVLLLWEHGWTRHWWSQNHSHPKTYGLMPYMPYKGWSHFWCSSAQGLVPQEKSRKKPRLPKSRCIMPCPHVTGCWWIMLNCSKWFGLPLDGGWWLKMVEVGPWATSWCCDAQTETENFAWFFVKSLSLYIYSNRFSHYGTHQLASPKI